MKLDEDYIEQLIEYNLSFNLTPMDTIRQLIKDGIEVSQSLIEEYEKVKK